MNYFFIILIIKKKKIKNSVFGESYGGNNLIIEY